MPRIRSAPPSYACSGPGSHSKLIIPLRSTTRWPCNSLRRHSRLPGMPRMDFGSERYSSAISLSNGTDFGPTREKVPVSWIACRSDRSQAPSGLGYRDCRPGLTGRCRFPSRGERRGAGAVRRATDDSRNDAAARRSGTPRSFAGAQLLGQAFYHWGEILLF